MVTASQAASESRAKANLAGTGVIEVFVLVMVWTGPAADRARNARRPGAQCLAPVRVHIDDAQGCTRRM